MTYLIEGYGPASAGSPDPERLAAAAEASGQGTVHYLGAVTVAQDETVFWLELLVEAGIISPARLGDLRREANELLAIFVSSQLTSKGISSNSKIRKSVNSPI